jgi:hypothetical protein
VRSTALISQQSESTSRRFEGDESPEHADGKGVKDLDTAYERERES